MKNKYLPFQIGEQYENWEFDLEYLQEEKIPGYDSYLYLWKKPFLHIIPSRIELIFSLDILQVVIMTCKFENLEQLNQFREILDLKFGERRKLENKYLDAEIYEIENLEMCLIYKPVVYRIDLAYGKIKYLREIYQ
ncbi:hypothetical protein [Chryseobacterium taklimakanense]|uniref:Uncharacterized protein n=1 Tax=Chryseobacterium taklimakanense TaxID=536441 RepID=A0A3G8WY89_9FLAO|nr:hypothetical protein [Chryseobacterium taklimakanense]AZI20726.1 hypothetical protein EIH08_08420 [Chryseobacterium taklimakanense]